jgi:hypothetical protein
MFIFLSKIIKSSQFGKYFYSFFSAQNWRMLANGLGLGEVGEIEAQMFNKPLMLIEVRMFKFSTSAPILPNPC